MNTHHPGPLLFLDEDALILRRSRPGVDEPVNTSRVATVQVEEPLLTEPLQITYSRLAVGFINRAARMYEIQWLTDLNKWVPRVLAPAIGLDAFPTAKEYDFEQVADRRPFGDGSLWWKDLVVRETVADTKRRFVWIDDQFTSGVMRRMAGDTVPWQSLLIPVRSGAAMSDRQLEQVAGFVGVRRQQRIAGSDR